MVSGIAVNPRSICPPKAGLAAIGLLALLLPAAGASGAGTITGTAWFEYIKGRPARFTNLHEWNLFLTPSATMFDDPISYRCDHGYYTFTNDAGNYTLYINQPEFFTRAKLIRNVKIVNNQTISFDPQMDTFDYACYYKNDWPGGWDHTWYQTFVATGSSINKIAYVFAGADDNLSSIDVTLLRDSGGNVTTWTPVGTKSGGVSRSSGEAWVGWRSGELTTTPGQRYAVRLVGQGSQRNFSPYWQTDSGAGYANGQAYDKYGVALNKDLNILVSSDNDGTVIPYMKTTGGLGGSTWWEWQWGQTFKATGESLAAVDLWFASGSDWNMQMTFKVYANPPVGSTPPSGQVGITKRGRGAWQAGGTAMMGIGYEPGEVPLTAGYTYYIEMTPYGGPIGYTPSKFDRAEDAYPYGHAYANRNPQTNIDLSMTIMEYAALGPPPEIERIPASHSRTIPRGAIPSNNTFTVRNVGGSVMYYNITDNVDWLGVNPASGDSSGEADTINIIYDTDELAMGNYTGTITIDAPAANNNPQTVTVYLTVGPPLNAPCDFDKDGDVDQDDFGRFQVCLSGEGIPQNNPDCEGALLDDDDDVDLYDYEIFLDCVSGPGNLADVLCAG